METPAFETVALRVQDGAAWVELNRPDALNAWNTQLGDELNAAVQWVADEEAVRAVVLTGAGRAFSSGADLKQGFEPTPAGHPDVHSRLAYVYHPIIENLRSMPKPVIAAVNGPAVGIGCSLALASDLVFAAESAYFLLAFVNIGLVPDGGSSLFIPARAGFTRAAEMALLGERVPAARALEWNLVNRVLPDDELRPEVEQLAARMAQGPTRSYAGTKRQLNRWVYSGLADQLRLEADIQQEMAGSGDFMEGVTAFVEKRRARFQGR
jgi:2-(1,2-epoxy-1,2-dihydrophenyl)acetyl-CoA isomerase